MSSRSSRVPRRVAALLLPFLMVACQSFGKRDDCDGCADARPKIHEPHVLSKPTLYSAARDLDHLEELIDWRGSVTAAVPGVWGQARLQQYREDFEKEMYKDIKGFQESLQGSLARSDQALMVSTTALSLAVSGKAATTKLPSGTYLTKDGENLVAKEVSSPIQQVVAPQAVIPLGYTVEEVDKDGNKEKVLKPLADASLFFTAPQLGFSADRFKAALATNDSGEAAKLRLSLEPERVLEQKKRYLDLLAQIRRTNEGDDTADAPGYMLQLFRIPVSVLPGKRTDVGFGAEITMSLAPVLGDDLLPTTFRNLVINDLVHQLGFPITQALNPGDEQDNFKDLITPQTQFLVDTTTLLSDHLVAGREATACKVIDNLGKRYDDVRAALAPHDQVRLDALRCKCQTTNMAEKPVDDPKKKQAPLLATQNGLALDSVLRYGKGSSSDVLMFGRREIKASESSRKGLALALSLPVLSFSPGAENRVALPTSQLVDVYGTTYAFGIALAARNALEGEVRRNGFAHLPNVQAFLKEELNAAYDLLANPENAKLWELCDLDLVHAVRTRAYDKLDDKRREFRDRVADLSGSKPDNKNRTDAAQVSRTAAFAWAILVDAALLNDKLCHEMKAQALRGGCAAPAQGWVPMYLPHPRHEDCRAFADYVKARWPIQVFALDPAIQEQNLADRLTTRRELQLALSLAFVSGRMNFNQFNRFARRLEAEYETIDVNRTSVGFNHGPATFGWRFYPRFQTPDTPSNTELIGRDLLYGGPNKNQLLRQRRLEPGPRECVAVVIMPSFVSGVRIESTSNFFPITNPKHKVFEHTDSVRLGRTVKALTTAGLSDAHCYRDGDAERLVNRARQLEARLPMQTNTFPVPTESSLGGFELFSTGTKSLAPELYGFYGAPGIHSAGGNMLFLVGDHFSPLRTKVIVGNAGVADAASPADANGGQESTVEATDLTLLSRQVMRIKVPQNLIPLTVTDEKTKAKRYYYTVHVATPYGVSRELLVPAVCPAKVCAEPKAAAAKPGFAFNGAKLVVNYSTTPGSKAGTFVPKFENPGADVRIAWTAPAGVTSSTVDLALEFEFEGLSFSVPCSGAIVRGTVGAQAIVIGKDARETIATTLYDLIVRKKGKVLPVEGNPLAKPLTSKKVTITPVVGKDAGLVVQPTETHDQLTVEFKEIAVCPEVPK